MEKRLPFPISDSTAIYPSKRSAITLQMDSPKPVPLANSSSFVKRLKTASCFSFGITNAGIFYENMYMPLFLSVFITNQYISLLREFNSVAKKLVITCVNRNLSVGMDMLFSGICIRSSTFSGIKTWKVW